MTFLTHLEDSTIQRLVEGALSPAEAAAAKTHIEACAPCRRRSGEISAVFTALTLPRTLPEPPVDFLALVMARVDLDPSLLDQRIRPRVAALAVAAGLATAVAGGALVALGGGADLPAAEIATGVTALLGKAGLLATLAKAAVPVVVAASFASAIALAPFLVRAIRFGAPPRRATVRR